MTGCNISHVYRDVADREFVVLDDVTVIADAGSRIALTGPSGSGKTTLLAILSLLLEPTTGSVTYDGEVMEVGDARARSERAFILQTSNVLPGRSAIDNAALPLLVRGVPHDHARAAGREALRRAGLASARLLDDAFRLSGGERQRVAIARALASGARHLFADEPTAHLDRRSADEVAEVLLHAAPPDGVLVLATHDISLARRCETVLELRDGVARALC